MKVYIASWFASKNKIRKKAEELRKHGIEVTSRWINETIPGNATVASVSEDYLRETAIIDIEDILAADTVVLITPTKKDYKTIPKPSWARGGRVFESGFQYGLMLASRFRKGRRLVIVGPKENVFHWLSEVEHFPDWKSFVRSIAT